MKRYLPVVALFAACNQPPTTPIIAIEPADPTSIDDLNLVFETPSFDQNKKDLVRYTIIWYRNGSEVEERRGEEQIPANSTFRDQTWRVEVIPNDGVLSGGMATAEVTVRNTPPEVDSVQLTPNSVDTVGVLEVSYTATDLDDDLVEATRSWEVNGMELSTSQKKLGGLDYFDKGDEVQAFVVVNDGLADSQRVGSQVVTVNNSPPTTPEIALSAEEPRPGQHLQCLITADADDLDGDALTYLFSWTMDGVATPANGTTEHDGDTVRGSQLESEQTWVCEVKASDGQVTGPAVTTSAVVTGGTIPGFEGEEGPTFKEYLQCEGYLDRAGGDDIPLAFGDDCVGNEFGRVRLACGTSESSYRYIDVRKNVFREGLAGFPETGLITAFSDQSGAEFSFVSNQIYAQGNYPNAGRSWWVTGNGCDEASLSLTVNNSCTWEASNCFGQNISGERYLWVYVAE